MPLGLKYACPSESTWKLAVSSLLKVLSIGLPVARQHASSGKFETMWPELANAFEDFLFTKRYKLILNIPLLKMANLSSLFLIPVLFQHAPRQPLYPRISKERSRWCRGEQTSSIPIFIYLFFLSRQHTEVVSSFFRSSSSSAQRSCHLPILFPKTLLARSWPCSTEAPFTPSRPPSLVRRNLLNAIL